MAEHGEEFELGDFGDWGRDEGRGGKEVEAHHDVGGFELVSLGEQCGYLGDLPQRVQVNHVLLFIFICPLTSLEKI